MTKDVVTQEDLKGIGIGKTEIYVLPNAEQIMSVRTICSRLKTFKGMEFKTTADVPNKTITVTRIK